MKTEPAIQRRPFASDTAERPGRPPLEVHQGISFRYAMPGGWRASETSRGVDMIAPDGQTLASAALLVGGFGPVTPQEFIHAALPTLGMANAQLVCVRELPGQPGLPGQSWNLVQVELSVPTGVMPIHAWVVCGVQPWFGRHGAITLLGRAPEARWPEVRHWLPALPQSMVVTDPRRVAGQDQVLLPRCLPAEETYRAYAGTWRERGLSPCAISRARSEGMLGYVRMADPRNGRQWALPLEAYDATIGGFRNPLRPEEMLVGAPAGE